VRTVRSLVEDLVRLVGVLTGEPPAVVPKRAIALLPLAEAAAAGLFTLAVLDPGVLACVSRPPLRLDEAGRLHVWDGRPAAYWESGRGLW